MKRLRVAFVFSHPIQHYAPICRELARHGDLDVRAFFCCDWGVQDYADPGFGKTISWDVPLLEGYAHEFLPIGRRPEKLGFWDVDNPGVIKRLEAFEPDAVWIHGYGHRTQLRVWSWAGRRHVRRLFFGDSELLHRRSLATRLAKGVFLPWFFRRIECFITIGDNNEAYYRQYGVPDERMFRGACPVDVGRFVAAGAMDSGERARRRSGYGLKAESVVALFVGKFIGIKRPLDMVEAVASVHGLARPVQALMVGSGELDQSLRLRARQLGAEDRIRFTGFVNQREMPSTLALGDILVMPSEVDPHPLAVAEAMSVGNAVIASDKVGCVGPTDAARPGVNTIVYRCGDREALSRAVGRLAADAAMLDEYRKMSRELAWTQDVSVAANAVRRALGRGTDAHD